MSIYDEIARCRKWIEDALEYTGGTHDFDDVVSAIMDGRMQLWAAPLGCAVTEIVVYPKLRSLHIFLAGADDMAQLIDMIESAVIWGQDQGCTSMTMAGRRGWEKILKQHGWKTVMTVMERSI